MFTISKILEVDNLKKWIQDNPNLLHPIDKKYIGYSLNVARPYWFDLDSRCNKISTMPIFSGTNQEEIFIKMYDWCLKNLKWHDGKIVNICHYLKKFNEEYLSDIRFDPTNYNGNYNDSNDSNVESGDDSNPHDDSSKHDAEISDKLDNINQNEYTIDWFDEKNCYKYQNDILELFFVTKLLFYGFDGGPYDCCFYVSPIIII